MSRNINDYLLITHTPNGRNYPFLDCWGLVVDVYREMCGITLDDHTDLTAETMQAGFDSETGTGHFREVETPQNYDIVAFFLAKRLYHVGIYYEGRILHTSERKNARFERIGPQTHRRFYRYVTN